MAITEQAARAPALETLRGNIIVGRARAQLSQDDLAERAGVSRPTISRIERGVASDVGIDIVQRIANALGITVAELFIPASAVHVDDDELARRAADPDSEFIDARTLLDAIDEAAGRPPLDRYSRAGRPPVAR